MRDGVAAVVGGWAAKVWLCPPMSGSVVLYRAGRKSVQATAAKKVARRTAARSLSRAVGSLMRVSSQSMAAGTYSIIR